MRTEVPRVRRCCFCAPLRRGLLFWGYLHLMLTILVSLVGLYVWYLLLMFGSNISDFDTHDALILVAIFSVFTSVLLICGAHQKNYKILKVQYVCSIVAVIVIAICLTIDGTEAIYYFFYYYVSTTPSRVDYSRAVHVSAVHFLFLLLLLSYIIFKLYVIVMVRSEVLKLRDMQLQCMYSNNAADAEASCTVILNDICEKKTDSEETA